MMQKDAHLPPEDLVAFFGLKKEDFGGIALVSGDVQRARACLEQVENPVENFTFMDYTFWTGNFRGKKVTIGNGGLFSPDSAITTELLCCIGVDTPEDVCQVEEHSDLPDRGHSGVRRGLAREEFHEQGGF